MKCGYKVHRTRKREASETTPFGLDGKLKESSTGTRQTETCVVVPRHMDESRGALLTICSLSFCTRLLFYWGFFLRTSSEGERGVRCQTLILFFSKPQAGLATV